MGYDHSNGNCWSCCYRDTKIKLHTQETRAVSRTVNGKCAFSICQDTSEYYYYYYYYYDEYDFMCNTVFYINLFLACF